MWRGANSRPVAAWKGKVCPTSWYSIVVASANSKPPAARRSPFWERLYSVVVSRNRHERNDREDPERRGLVVTLCILVSAFLWFTFSLRETYSALLLMPTEVVNLPQDEALKTPPPPLVRVQVEGEGLSLLRLRLNPPTIPINASADQIDLQRALPELPKNIRPVSVSPSTLDLQKEQRITRKIPVRLRAEIETPATHDLVAPPQLAPDSVLVSGAASIVRGLEAWPTRPVSYEDVRDTLITRIPLADTLQGLVQRNIEATTLKAVSQQFTEGTREIDVIVTEQPSNQKLVSLDPETIRVRYRVLFSQYSEALRAPDFFATVSYDEIRADTTGRIRPRIHLPSDVVLLDVDYFPQTLNYFQRIE